MSEPFQDMPNQRPNFIGSGLASLTEFFADTRVDQGKLQTIAAVLSKRGITAAQMQRIVTTATEECDRFPTLAWILKLTSKRKSDGDGWADEKPHATGALDSELTSHERRWISKRSVDIWKIKRALDAGLEPHALMDKLRLYIDHNRYLRAAPNGDLVRTSFETRTQVRAEMDRLDYAIPVVTGEMLAGGGASNSIFYSALDRIRQEQDERRGL